MKQHWHNIIFAGTMLTSAWSAGIEEAPATDGTGVAAVAPQIPALGTGWAERTIVFVVDPLDQPPETVNDTANQDPSNRIRLLALVKAGMKREGAVGMGYFGYGFGNLIYGQGRYDLYLSRFPDERSLAQQWNGYTLQSDQAASEPAVGDKALWLRRSAADQDHRLVIRKGLYLARLECTATQERERLVHLARTTLERISK